MYLKKPLWSEGITPKPSSESEPEPLSTAVGDPVNSTQQRVYREVMLALRSGLRDVRAEFSFLVSAASTTSSSSSDRSPSPIPPSTSSLRHNSPSFRGLSSKPMIHLILLDILCFVEFHFNSYAFLRNQVQRSNQCLGIKLKKMMGLYHRVLLEFGAWFCYWILGSL